jgi:hypothetical protein
MASERARSRPVAYVGVLGCRLLLRQCACEARVCALAAVVDNKVYQDPASQQASPKQLESPQATSTGSRNSSPAQVRRSGYAEDDP